MAKWQIVVKKVWPKIASTVKHGYNDHGYNEFMVITNKICWYFGSQIASLLRNSSRL